MSPATASFARSAITPAASSFRSRDFPAALSLSAAATLSPCSFPRDPFPDPLHKLWIRVLGGLFEEISARGVPAVQSLGRADHAHLELMARAAGWPEDTLPRLVRAGMQAYGERMKKEKTRSQEVTP